jgi:hypothetical protein
MHDAILNEAHLLQAIRAWRLAAWEAITFIGACRRDFDCAKAWYDSRPVRPDPNSNRGWGWVRSGTFSRDTEDILRAISEHHLGTNPASLKRISNVIDAMTAKSGTTGVHADWSTFPTQQRLQRDLAKANAVLDLVERAAKERATCQSQTVKRRRPKLTPAAAMAYEILKGLPEHKGLTSPMLIVEMDKKGHIADQSTLTTHILPQLRPYGLRNERRRGYYIEKEGSGR